VTDIFIKKFNKQPYEKSFSSSFSEIDLQNRRADFVVRFTLVRRSAVKIFRTLSLIVNSLKNIKKIKTNFIGLFLCFSALQLCSELTIGDKVLKSSMHYS